MQHHPLQRLLLIATIAFAASRGLAEDGSVSFQSETDSVAIFVNDQHVGTYFLRDPSGKVKRPYFAHVKTLGGTQVTRNHPPGPDDRDDHATMHPGIWLGFGDVNGVDFWRNQGDVQHVTFVQPPLADDSRGGFIQHKQYVDQDGAVICDEEFKFGIHAWADAYLLSFDSTFTSQRTFYFGDQEEMGLGIRVATPISEVSGGTLQDATGRAQAKAIWSHSANWCNYGGVIDDREVGVAVFCHPSNFRASWFHARDYGLLVANPFGRAAMKKGEPSRVQVPPAGSLRLRYAVLVHAGYAPVDIDAFYQKYVADPGVSR
ncbi:MAG: PmoA family protein [bacterium]|nr:PmoA family protein [bacterium]